jgi:hypothetical protein
VRRAGLALFAAAALLAGAAPAWSGDDGKVAPTAALSVSPQSVTAGDPIALDASGSRDADGTVTSYAWDLDGDGAFERQSGTEATLAHAFETAGTHTVGVRVVDDSGDAADATASVQVAEKPAPEPEPAAEPAPAAPPPAPGCSAGCTHATAAARRASVTRRAAARESSCVFIWLLTVDRSDVIVLCLHESAGGGRPVESPSLPDAARGLLPEYTKLFPCEVHA